MTDTTAKIRSKGCEGTGITEEIATDLFQSVGTHMMAIVDLQVVDKSGPNIKGKRTVEIVIDGIEPATDDNLAEHLRELTRTCYFNRQTDQPLTLDDNIEPDLKTVLEAGRRLEPHPYLASTLSTEDEPVCDVCGLLEPAAVHADRSLVADPFADNEVDDDQDGDTEDDTEDDTEGNDNEGSEDVIVDDELDEASQPSYDTTHLNPFTPA